MAEQTINPCTNTVYTRSGINLNLKQNKEITVVVASYKGYSEIEVLINSFLSQKLQNWKMIIGHDGPDDKMKSIVERYTKQYDFIRYFQTDKRANKWGHNLRNIALNMVDTHWIVNTNDDNYYVPTFTQEIHNMIHQPNTDVVTYNCVHSYFKYISFKPTMRQSGIDMGQFVIKSHMLKDIRFNEDNPSADGIFITNVVNKYKPKVKYINQNLFIHN